MKIKSPYLPAHRITIEPVDRVKFIKKIHYTPVSHCNLLHKNRARRNLRYQSQERQHLPHSLPAITSQDLFHRPPVVVFLSPTTATTTFKGWWRIRRRHSPSSLARVMVVFLLRVFVKEISVRSVH